MNWSITGEFKMEGIKVGKYELVSDYRHDVKLKESFNKLAIDTFDLELSDWYERGYWDEKYIPYSFVHNGKVISNASVLMNEENETMHVFDIISLQTPNVEEVVESIVKETTKK